MKHFLYLIKRDKKGVILLYVFKGEKIPKIFLNDFENIGLSEEAKEKCHNYYNSLRFNWQIVLESEESFDLIKKKLHKNGFKNIQLDNVPLFQNLESAELKIFEKLPKKMLQKKNI